MNHHVSSASPNSSAPLISPGTEPSTIRNGSSVTLMTTLPSSFTAVPLHPFGSVRYVNKSYRVPQMQSYWNCTSSVSSLKPAHQPAILRPNSSCRASTNSHTVVPLETNTASLVVSKASLSTTRAIVTNPRPLKILNAVSLQNCDALTSALESRRSITYYPIYTKGQSPNATKTPSTFQLLSRPTATYRIPLPNNARPGTLTTPTKDQQLASQLNGLFQNLSPSRTQPVKRTTLFQAKEFPNSISCDSSTRISHPVIPQIDGTLDDDDEYRIVKRSRSRFRHCSHSGRRSTSATSNDSMASTKTTASGASKTLKGVRSSIMDHRNFQKQSQKSALSMTVVPAKRRWIEERNKQQELAHLVSKAKLANHARMYQHEVEKHARSFRLRFSIDGFVRAAPTPAVAWSSILTRVAALREKQGLPSLLYGVADGWMQFGLSHRHIVFLIEQMRGAFHCYRYRFRYHRRKIERLRQKFTPPIPVPEGCARAISWSKPRLPSDHARDPLSFLNCAGNPAPRPLMRPGQSVASQKDHFHASNTVLSLKEKTTMLTQTEQAICAEAARQAASLVASHLKLPMRVREACIAHAVVQATGFPLQSSDDPESSSAPKGNWRTTAEAPYEDYDIEQDNESSEEDKGQEEDADLGTITTQFKRMVSGPMARYLRVAVHPSHIHGRGLFALRGFREDEMVIEYMGELIRNFVCETREIRYRSAGVDCYMFRIDSDLVIDATYAGNAARFINHSCDPNCYAKVITVDDKKHIVILAQRRIYPGEELTYDYRFPKESDKLLCNCGSNNCRKYLN